jgi:hypothetical protein
MVPAIINLPLVESTKLNLFSSIGYMLTFNIGYTLDEEECALENPLNSPTRYPTPTPMKTNR